MQKIVWADSVKNEEVLQRLNEKSNFLTQKKQEGCLDWSHLV
jgi:hypothetical protein